MQSSCPFIDASTQYSMLTSLFLHSFLNTYNLRLLFDVRPYALSLLYLSFGLFIRFPRVSILRMVESTLPVHPFGAHPFLHPFDEISTAELSFEKFFVLRYYFLIFSFISACLMVFYSFRFCLCLLFIMSMAQFSIPNSFLISWL